MKVESKYLKVPLYAQLEITDLCNHKCIHCYHLDSELNNRPIEVINDKTVLECAQRLVDNNIFEVSITGGEPFIKKKLLAKLIKFFVKNNIDISINTNLTLLSDDILNLICNNRIGLLVSCPSAIPSSFEKLVGVNSFTYLERNIKKLIDNGVNFTVNMVVHKMNIKEIRQTATFFKKLGCMYFAATPMCPNIDFPHRDLLLSKDEVIHVINDLLWIEKNLDLYVDLLEVIPKCLLKDKVSIEHEFFYRKCQAGRTSIAVSPSGSVRPCAHVTKSYGNLLQEDMCEIWERMRDWRSLAYIPQDCQCCQLIHYCNGGCRVSAKAIYGEWYSMDRLATTPISLPFPIVQSNKTYEFNTVFEMNDFKYREEDSNTYVIYVKKYRTSLMVNKEFFDFIIELNKKNIFEQKELNEIWGLSNEQCCELITLLLDNKLIKYKINAL